MDMNRRALYNSLRMNWVMQPTAEVEAWQVEDYRSMPLDGLFERLEDQDIRLDKASFVAFAESVDTPEDLTDALLVDVSDDAQLHDRIYLIVFELWRRLLPEKPCVSIFCDELDHQIHLYDQGPLENPEEMEDALANLKVLLDENTDEGADPQEAFDYINSGCANSIETFLHDFISEQIDNANFSYAVELLDGFSPYVHDVNWFHFLRARQLSSTDPEEANAIIKDLISQKSAQADLELNLEMLSFLVAFGDKETFEIVVKNAAALLEVEEDFQALLSICADFYHRLDREHIEKALQKILKERALRDPEKPFDSKDAHFSELFKIISKG